MEWIFKLNQIYQTATQLWKVNRPNATVFAIHGDMGAGKNHFYSCTL